MRRTILIIAAVVVIIGAALGVYLLFFSANTPELTTGDGVSFGPSGDFVPGGSEGPGSVGDTEEGAGEVIAPRLVKITPGPVAFGSVAFTVREEVPIEPIEGATTTASTTIHVDTEVRYLERASGNAYGYRLEERTLTRLSNRTLPGVYEATWLSDGSATYARFLTENDAGTEVLETYALPVGNGEGGYFLEPGLSEVMVRGTSTLVTLLPSSSGSIATAASTDGSNPRTLFTSPLSSLKLLASGGAYGAYTKASANANGYAFSISSGGAFERVAGPLRGLTILPSPSGRNVLYTYLSGSALRAELLEMSSRVSTPVPLGALSEKCVWAPDEASVYCAVPRSVSGTLPDDWYQGAVSFSDRIWKVDLAARVAILVIDPLNAGGVAVDAVNLAIDPRADALVFTNKKDGSLWVYDL